MPETERVLLVLPTYNEAPHVDDLVGEILDTGPSLSVLFVDDGSTDGTLEIAEQWMAKCDRVSLLRRGFKQGLGSAYVAGFEWGLAKDFNFFIEMDADRSHDPKDLPRLIEAIASTDLVIGSRYIAGGDVVGWSKVRHTLSRMGNLYARVILGFKVKDSTSGFRCYRRSVLEQLDLSSLASDGYSFQIEMAYRAWKQGFNVREIPIVFRERTAGESKMSGAIVAEALFQVPKWRLASSKRQKELGEDPSA